MVDFIRFKIFLLLWVSFPKKNAKKKWLGMTV